MPGPAGSDGPKPEDSVRATVPDVFSWFKDYVGKRTVGNVKPAVGADGQRVGPAHRLRLDQGRKLAIRTHDEDRIVFDIGNVDVIGDIDAEAVAERLVAESLNAIGQLCGGQMLVAQIVDFVDKRRGVFPAV